MDPVISPNHVAETIAGGAGGVLAALFRRDATKLAIFTTLVSSGAVVYYVTTPIWQVVRLKWPGADDNWRNLIAFALGLLAVYILTAITKMASDFSASPWKLAGDGISWLISRVVPWKKKGD